MQRVSSQIQEKNPDREALDLKQGSSPQGIGDNTG